STLFPYTTLFRSHAVHGAAQFERAVRQGERRQDGLERHLGAEERCIRWLRPLEPYRERDPDEDEQGRQELEAPHRESRPSPSAFSAARISAHSSAQGWNSPQRRASRPFRKPPGTRAPSRRYPSQRRPRCSWSHRRTKRASRVSWARNSSKRSQARLESGASRRSAAFRSPAALAPGGRHSTAERGRSVSRASGASCTTARPTARSTSRAGATRGPRASTTRAVPSEWAATLSGLATPATSQPVRGRRSRLSSGNRASRGDTRIGPKLSAAWGAPI